MEFDSDFLNQPAGDGADGDARGRLAGARALQDRPDVVESVLEHAGEVGVAGAEARDLHARLVRLLDGHDVLPVDPVLVVQQ